MRKIIVTVGAVVVAFGLFGRSPASAVDRYTPADRAAIRATPILERPSRPGHFYGNTVRRRADRQGAKVAG